MLDLIQQTRQALDCNFYYLGLFSTLAIPDICGAIGALDGRATGERYKNWYTQYVVPKYDILSADECYRFRCTALHQGRSEPALTSDYDRVIFFEPSAARQNRIQLNAKRISAQGQSAILIHLEEFVEHVLVAAENWIKDSKGADPFQSNYDRFMHRYLHGFPPLVAGMPVIT